MEVAEFFNKIERHQKIAAGILEENTHGYLIKRGMAHVVSGYLEDLFAVYVAENIKNRSFKYYVDKVTSLRLNSSEKAISFKPDLSIIKNDTLTHYFDLKTNLGWNRDFVRYLEIKNDFIETIKGKKAWIRWGQFVEEISIADDLKYQMVVLYGWNINQEKLYENLQKASIYKNVEVHILSPQNAVDNKPNLDAFSKILKSIK
jgi:hypothetical protein